MASRTKKTELFYFPLLIQLLDNVISVGLNMRQREATGSKGTQVFSSGSDGFDSEVAWFTTCLFNTDSGRGADSSEVVEFSPKTTQITG
uniref:Uncharacterized protein n=1 Tax=Parascaris equorum TaxID=6256 RepID=A0A914S2Q6_PAREQ